MFARNWRPNSFLIAIFEAIYAVTEPAMAYVRRFVPPLRLGGVAIDLSFIVLIIAVDLLRGIIRVAL
jgi:YggT family protein